MAEKFKSKLTVTGQHQLATFKTKKGADQPIYEVEAVDADGKKVTKPLRTFHEDLPQGELIEFDVEPYDYQGTLTYTLKLPSKGRASKKDISELRKQHASLADRVSAMEGEMSELRSEVARLRGLGGEKEEKPF